MPTSRRFARVLFFHLILSCAAAFGQELVVTPDHADGIYKSGDTVEWKLQWKGNAPPASIDYVVRKGGITEIAKGKIDLNDGVGSLKAKIDEPNTLFAEFKSKSKDGKEIRSLGGAVADWEKIKPASTRPKDFDAFWEAKIKELQAVAMNPQLESGESKKDGVDWWRISMDNIRGSHIRGQLARPKQGDRLPALLVPQWAGVYPLEKQWITDIAAQGWLVLNINAHDLPIDENADFYAKQFQGPLKDYWSIGNDDRDKSYFLRMYLSCYRGAEYLTQRPDWDGKTLVVSGGSQGGMQSLMTAAIFPKITAALANVPAGCDLLGPDAGHDAGWPKWYWKTEGGKDAKKVREAARYYDIAHFAPRIKCPVMVAAGLIDDTCPAVGIFAAVNQIKGPKEVIVMPNATHSDVNHSQAQFYNRWGAWLWDLKQGKSPIK